MAARSNDGHWLGELSSSALATATAVTALAVTQRELRGADFQASIARGLHWLAGHANPDGGWGDTILNRSNLSTTTLGWAAFGAVPGAAEQHPGAVTRAAQWLRQHTGGLGPDQLSPAIIQRYGKDRTFSVPILTMGALSGRWGSGPDAWRHIIPLPFELAACPHSWFAALRLPVVSYALPALIAIGQARHHHRPSRNPVARLVRTLVRPYTLKVLTNLQPSNGGFLEATPLTSFVVMSLAGSGQAEHPVTRRGLGFLQASQRPDGSWPIDTNLATWITTLAVNALAPADLERASQPSRIRDWLLAQQYRRQHRYTNAAPGGWAWTDLPGGVPDADDTAGALLALRRLGPLDAEVRAAGRNGIGWLLGLQNTDGGIPTFCRGWGTLPFDRSSADITAHAIRAWAAWRDELPAALQRRTATALQRALAFLGRIQRADGSWVPLWFGNEFAPAEENPTYGTARVLCALADENVEAGLHREGGEMVSKGVGWLLGAQNNDGSWGGCAQGQASVEETALAVEALAAMLAREPRPGALARDRIHAAVGRGTGWLIERVESGQWHHPAPIGFYFAKLWYHERLYPLIFTVGALERLAAAPWWSKTTA